jgi:hypothetical protein
MEILIDETSGGFEECIESFDEKSGFWRVVLEVIGLAVTRNDELLSCSLIDFEDCCSFVGSDS